MGWTVREGGSLCFCWVESKLRSRICGGDSTVAYMHIARLQKNGLLGLRVRPEVILEAEDPGVLALARSDVALEAIGAKPLEGVSMLKNIAREGKPWCLVRTLNMAA
jgi:hypothetical protein